MLRLLSARVLRAATTSTTLRPLALSRRYYGSAAAVPTQAEVQERIMNIFRLYDKIDPSKAHFIKDLGLDSLDVVECVNVIEEDFSLEFQDEEAESIFTVEQAAQAIMKQLH